VERLFRGEGLKINSLKKNSEYHSRNMGAGNATQTTRKIAPWLACVFYRCLVSFDRQPILQTHYSLDLNPRFLKLVYLDLIGKGGRRDASLKGA
jgi:hypothetical protein